MPSKIVKPDGSSEDLNMSHVSLEGSDGHQGIMDFMELQALFEQFCTEKGYTVTFYDVDITISGKDIEIRGV